MKRNISHYQRIPNRVKYGGLAFFFLAAVGIGAGAITVQQNQDLRQQAAYTWSAFSAVDGHATFWMAPPWRFVGKQFTRNPASKNPGYSRYWQWSGPHNNSTDNSARAVHYSVDGSQSDKEWESWSYPTGGTAILKSYGGPTEAQSRPVYRSNADCVAGRNRGVEWPSLGAGTDFAVVPQARSVDGVCRREWNGSTGSYIAMYLDRNTVYPANTAGRNAICDRYVPGGVSGTANRICKTAPNTAVIYNRYADVVQPGVLWSGYGCEITVRTWGYPPHSTERYKRWLRNGEVMFSDYYNLGTLPDLVRPDDHGWWSSRCQQRAAIPSNVPHWLYNGLYRTDGVDLRDNGY